MNSVSRCSNHVSLEKVKVLTRPLVNLCYYESLRNVIRSWLYRANIALNVNKAVVFHSFSMISEEKGYAEIARTLSKQALCLLKEARFTEGCHPELDKIFHHSYILAPSDALYEEVQQKMTLEVKQLQVKEGHYAETFIRHADKNKKAEAYEKWQAAFPSAYAGCKAQLDLLHIPLKHTPPILAAIVAELFLSHGLMLYADSLCPLKTGLASLKMAFLLSHYSLGFSASCPDLSWMKEITDLHTSGKKSKALEQEADVLLQELQTEEWVKKLTSLPQERLLSLVTLLSALNGVASAISASNPSFSDKLLVTVTKSLEKAIGNLDYDQMQMKDHLAEFKFHELSEQITLKASQMQKEGNISLHDELIKLWEECVNLAKESDMMWARCLMKHTLLVGLSPEDKIKLLKKSLDIYLIQPIEKQDAVQVALVWYYLAQAQNEGGEPNEAIKCSAEALKLAQQCLNAGQHSVEMEEIVQWAKNFEKPSLS